MLRAVWLQGELFPEILLVSAVADSSGTMEDAERDRRTPAQWLRAINAYLEFMSGDSWRRGADRDSSERWYYLDAIRFLNGIGSEERVPFSRTISITPRTIQEIRISSLASWPIAKLIDELFRLNPLLTNRKLLSHYTKVKLAQMLIAARAASRKAHAMERVA